jgi:hypothetical protein
LFVTIELFLFLYFAAICRYCFIGDILLSRRLASIITDIPTPSLHEFEWKGINKRALLTFVRDHNLLPLVNVINTLPALPGTSLTYYEAQQILSTTLKVDPSLTFQLQKLAAIAAADTMSSSKKVKSSVTKVTIREKNTLNVDGIDTNSSPLTSGDPVDDVDVPIKSKTKRKPPTKPATMTNSSTSTSIIESSLSDGATIVKTKPRSSRTNRKATNDIAVDHVINFASQAARIMSS